LKSDDTLDVRNAAAAFPAAKPRLRRAASSEQHEPASRGGIPHPRAPWPQSGSPVEESCHARGRRRRSRKARPPKNARQAGLVALPAPLKNPRDLSPGRFSTGSARGGTPPVPSDATDSWRRCRGQAAGGACGEQGSGSSPGAPQLGVPSLDGAIRHRENRQGSGHPCGCSAPRKKPNSFDSRGSRSCDDAPASLPGTGTIPRSCMRDCRSLFSSSWQSGMPRVL